jgi:lipopolysaccharide transport system permease protein
MENKKVFTISQSNKASFLLTLENIFIYKDLLYMFVKRDFVSYYKQTILGPIWFFLQPLFTTLIYMFIFNKVANISTDGIPSLLFYFSGITLWNYFSDCLNKTATTFKDNASIFGKVYFPRIILPVSIIISSLIKFFIQYAIFIFLVLFFNFRYHNVHPNILIIATPVIVFFLALISLGLGLIITSMTTKYRDLIFLLTFGIQLFMYLTPVIFPISEATKQLGKYANLLYLNPLTSLFEVFRNAYLGVGQINYNAILYTIVFSIITILLGVRVFNKVEKDFVDTV